MPSDFRLCAVGARKQPIDGDGWYELCADRDADFYLGLNGSRPIALGLLLGPATGLMAVDRDAKGWREKFREITKHDINELPKTIAFTSGKPGRMQQVYTVPLDLQQVIQHKSYQNADGETCLEFRWGIRTQSVILGFHPDTGSYRWVEGCSPQELGDPAEAPEWLLEKMLAPEYDDTNQPEPTEADAIEAVAILSLLPPKEFQAHDPWIKVGMALHHVGVDVAHWIEWSRTMTTFDEKECRTRWKSFAKYSRRKVGLGSLRRYGIPYGHVVPKPPAEVVPIELLPEGFVADRLRQKLNALRETSTVTPHLQDCSTPGSGKTRLVAPFSRLIRQDGIKLVIYVSPHYRSPSDPALELWASTAARHPGIVATKVNGFDRFRRLKRGEKKPLVEAATCRFSHVLDQLTAQGVSAVGRSEWCQECVEHDSCSFVEQQKDLVSDIQQGALRQLRTTISMLPAIKEWAGRDRWAATVVVVDEAPQLLDAATQEHAVSYAQLRQWTHDIMHNDMITGKELLHDLVRILVNMPERFEEKDAKINRHCYRLYGFNVQETAAELVQWKERAGDFFDDWHLDLINDIDLPTTDDPDADIELPIPLLLPHLIRAALNTDGSSLSCDPKGVNIYQPADDVRDALNSAAGVLILDGTTDPADTRIWAAADPQSFAAVRSSEDTGLQNVQIVQVHGMGTMSSSREKSRHADRDEFIAHATSFLMQHLEKTEPKVGVIDHKKFARQGMGYWGADHRGTNAYADADALIACGLPLQALGPALARFATAHRVALADSDTSAAFDAWYERRLAEDLLQTVHRLRPLRRAGSSLTVWILSDRSIHIPGASIIVAKAQAFSPLIGSTAHRFLDNLAQLINRRPDLFAPITQAHAATLLHQFLSAANADTSKPTPSPASLERKIQRCLKDARLSWRQFRHDQTWCADTWASP